ncbi:universal stress protein [Dactylosporangium aurantiacum]|uniref:Universal stress protein n=1 Tax=Dactylosporangium aurantiacum TaxID=35754 RepID=A0A9Q9IRV9_9ACTN|nr:universal stress protein [Dactylosporangium aurantiacum]MDG6110122.1 universal stress protein [Dactylosporangium aurantiacum]UWZ57868.1 universal stress protein [Dactylosporangium aurantiacum]
MGYQYGPVVVGVDGSPDSVGALRWAADEACRNCRELLAVHVLDPALQWDERDGDPGIAARAAEEAFRWRPGVCATGVTERGVPAEVLRQHTEESRLVVVGGHGTGRNTAQPLGSVADGLSAAAQCPVLVVHAAQRWADPSAVLPDGGPVVVGFDGSDSARRALRLAFEEAAARSRRIVVVQVWQHPQLWRPGEHHEGPEHRDQADDQADDQSGRQAEYQFQHHCRDLTADESAVHEALVAAAEPWHAKFPLVNMELRSEPGDPVEALTVASQWAMLMVLGTRCPTDAVQPPNPSVMQRVLRGMACPALIAHGTTAFARTPQTAGAR